ncbi:MAG: HAD-superfamily hydrolase subfamily IA variant 3 [Spirochaetes bacterium]|nr:MAG: HAD-superfamily hydrolase subfamily IA variant 3 [Spirochaetota bacterium]
MKSTFSGVIKAFMFDLDGTLAETIQDLGDSVNLALKDNGYPPHPIENYKKMVGNGFATLIRRALPPDADLDADGIERITALAAETYGKNLLRTTKPFLGIPQVLRELSQRGCPLAVLSNKPHALTKKMVERLFPDIPFVDFRGDSPGKAKKPFPGQALEIAGLVPLHVSDWAFVGDSGVDMETGNSCGMTAIGVLWGYRGKEELLNAGARLLVQNPEDLLLYI